MKTSRVVVLILAFMIGLTFLLAGCTPPPPDGGITQKPVQTDKYKVGGKNGYKFDPPITVTTMRFYGPQVKFLQGENIDNNVWTKAYVDYCGIKLNDVFTVTDFTQFDLKVTTSIATDTLPDIIPVYTTLFFRIADSGRLTDLTKVYNDYLDPNLKTLMEKEGGGVAYSTCKRNGILAALAAPNSPSPAMQWIRTDWLKNYNLSWPKNINESISAMEMFCKKNAGAPMATATYALPITGGDLQTGFANAFGAYSGMWIDDGKGGLMRSDIDVKWKTVLSKLSDMWYKGYIDPSFTLSNGSTIESQFTQQQFGFSFGGSSAPDGALNQTIKTNLKAEWKQGLITGEDGKPALMQAATRIGGFSCVNKKSAYPEALIFLTNIYGPLMNGIGKEFQQYHDIVGADGVTYSTFFYPLVAMAYPYQDFKTKIGDAVKTGDKSKLTGEMLGILGYFDMWKDTSENALVRANGWRIWSIYKPGGAMGTRQEIVDKKYLIYDRGWGPEVATWIAKGPDLSNSATKYFLWIIRGDKTVDAGFDEWVKYFNDNGGKAATDEMNVWWQAEGKATFPKIVANTN